MKFFTYLTLLLSFASAVAIISIILISDFKPIPPLSSFTYGVSVDKELLPFEIELASGPWVGGNWDESNTVWLKQFQDPKRTKQIPYINLYVIAGLASEKKGLSDCNVGQKAEKTLCVEGANFIRDNKTLITAAHKDIVLAIKNNYGTEKPIFLHFEPDYYQYQEHSQNGGRMTADELSELMNGWTDMYKSELPNAHLVMDVSSWNYDLKYWSDKFRNFEYSGMVGRRFEPMNQGRDSNGNIPKTYKELTTLTGKKMIINDSHGPGGKWLQYNKNWENQNLVRERFDDGVVAVIEPPTNIESLTKTIKESKE